MVLYSYTVDDDNSNCNNKQKVVDADVKKNDKTNKFEECLMHTLCKGHTIGIWLNGNGFIVREGLIYF